MQRGPRSATGGVMGFGKIKRRPQSLREKLQESQRGLNLWAAMSGKPAIQLDIPEKRSYTKRAEGSNEHKEQCAVIDWWRSACGSYRLPEFALFAVPNGAHLASGYIGAGKLKREGMRPGALDLQLAAPRQQFHGLFLEMKFGKNKPSEEQEAFISHLARSGYSVSVHWTADSAIKAIKEYLA